MALGRVIMTLQLVGCGSRDHMVDCFSHMIDCFSHMLDCFNHMMTVSSSSSEADNEKKGLTGGVVPSLLRAIHTPESTLDELES